jgi:hypothetical protein
VIPLLTLLVAGAAGFLNVVGIVPMSPVEGIIVALLALLAVDALSERLSILEKIETKLSAFSREGELRDRSQLLLPEQMAQTASDIALIAVSGYAVIGSHLSFFEKKIEEGCKIRIILLDPKSPSLQTWNLLCKVTTTERDILTSLDHLRGLMELERAQGRCEVRLSEVYAPFGIFAVNPSKDTGVMIVEFHTYRMTFESRPHVFLSRTQNRQWFDFYVGQFEQMWIDSGKWTP